MREYREGKVNWGAGTWGEGDVHVLFRAREEPPWMYVTASWPQYGRPTPHLMQSEEPRPTKLEDVKKQ